MEGERGHYGPQKNHLSESEMPYSHLIFLIFCQHFKLERYTFENVTHVFLLLEWNATLENPTLLMVAHNIHKAAG